MVTKRSGKRRLTNKLLWEAYSEAARWGNRKYGTSVEWRRELSPHWIIPFFRKAIHAVLKRIDGDDNAR
jgi:hypothetical protein